MKLLAAKYNGIEDDLWSKVVCTVSLDGKTFDGTLLFENDGRDIESEGDEGGLILEHLADIMESDEAMVILEPVLAVAYKDWNAKH